MGKIVVIASSTGGPRALQHVLPKLPANLNAPVLLVQHMLPDFTQGLAKRLDEMSEIHVKEAAEHEPIQRGYAYVAPGGVHMNYEKGAKLGSLYFSDQPNRQGVKPCADYLFESLRDSSFDEIVCVVMTGMGCDATEGILRLAAKKKVFVIAQDEPSCTVYGMPRSIVEAGKADKIVDLDQIAQEIILKVGVKKDGC